MCIRIWQGSGFLVLINLYAYSFSLGFSSPAWKVSLVTVVGMVALIQHADYVTEGGKKEHPLTQYLRGQMPDEKEVARLEEKHIVETEREARLNLMQANHRSATMHTPVYPE